MSRASIPPKGMAPPRWHKHACGHGDFCTLGGDFAATTLCRECKANPLARVGKPFHQTNQQITNDSLDAERAALYLAHESGGPGSEF